MIKPTNKVVVVGGGSSGWMSAAALIRTFPEKDIVVIESPDVPTVGVGESTLGQFKTFCNFLEIEEEDFMKFTDASYKMSIKFTNFFANDSSSFHYPFGIPFTKNTLNGLDDWFVKKAMFPETPISDFVHCYFPSAALFERNKFSENLDGKFESFNPKTDVAYHFDAIKFALWLRDRYCKPRGVKHIQATVTDIKVGENGIEKLVLNTGDEIQSDLFIDCTGFRSLLIGDALKQEFFSYGDVLPNNRAWAAQVPYKNKSIELEAYTHCTAIENGWVWNTPVWTRIGTGYVYSDKFVDPETALEEFKRHLMSDKMVCPRTREEVESLKFRDISMRVGAYKNTFVKNVVAIGLSAGFIEPLESNGLFTVHEFLYNLLKLLQRPAITQLDKELYNIHTFRMWKSFADFVALHYGFSTRDDTPYWKANLNRSHCKDGPDIFHETLIRSMFNTHSNPGMIDGINWIAVGMHHFFYDKINFDKSMMNAENIGKYKRTFRIFEDKKERWRKFADDAPSLYEYQKQKIYNEE
jgi:tryptophan halogenase